MKKELIKLKKSNLKKRKNKEIIKLKETREHSCSNSCGGLKKRKKGRTRKAAKKTRRK